MKRLLLSMLLAAVSLPAADLSGIWLAAYPSRLLGEVVDVAFKFTQNGSVIGGKMYGDYISTAIIEGKVNGDDVEFVIIQQQQAGNEINNTRLKFTGKLKNGQIEMTQERESAQRAGSGADVQFRGSATLHFTLRRLL